MYVFQTLQSSSAALAVFEGKEAGFGGNAHPPRVGQAEHQTSVPGPQGGVHAPHFHLFHSWAFFFLHDKNK